MILGSSRHGRPVHSVTTLRMFAPSGVGEGEETEESEVGRGGGTGSGEVATEYLVRQRNICMLCQSTALVPATHSMHLRCSSNMATNASLCTEGVRRGSNGRWEKGISFSLCISAPLALLAGGCIWCCWRPLPWAALAVTAGCASPPWNTPGHGCATAAGVAEAGSSVTLSASCCLCIPVMTTAHGLARVQGRAGQGRAGQGRAGQGRAGQGMQGRTGQWQGKPRQSHARTGQGWARAGQLQTKPCKDRARPGKP